MTFEEASDMYAMYSISPQLTCQCDDIHMCQQCYEECRGPELPHSPFGMDDQSED